MRKQRRERLSGTAYAAFVLSALSLPLLSGRRRALAAEICVLGALAGADLASAALKRLIPERRPDSPKHTSFPSKHTANSFAVAASSASACGFQPLPWYAGAALVGASRLFAGRHRLRDVIAGAACGMAIGKALAAPLARQ